MQLLYSPNTRSASTGMCTLRPIIFAHENEMKKVKVRKSYNFSHWIMTKIVLWHYLKPDLYVRLERFMLQKETSD